MNMKTNKKGVRRMIIAGRRKGPHEEINTEWLYKNHCIKNTIENSRCIMTTYREGVVAEKY